MNEKRFILQRSSKADNRLVCTDTENKIVCEFTFGKFNETQKFTLLEDLEGEKVNELAKKMPTIMREFRDWLAQYHYFAVMPFDDASCRVHIARMIARERENRGLSRYELSKRSGVQIINISRIEEGKYSARMDTIIKLLQAMDLEMQVF